MISMLWVTNPWHIGQKPVEFSAHLRPLWAWRVEDRRALWMKHKHPKAKKYREHVLWTKGMSY